MSDDSPRARIIEAALVEFSARGFDATSIQRVADRAGMSKQALMHHFPQKAALRDGVYALLAERLTATLPTIFDDIQSEEHDRQRSMVRAVAEKFAQSPVVSRFLVRELLDAPAPTLGWIHEQTGALLEVIVEVTERNRDPSVVGDDFDVEAHVTVIAGLLLSLSALVHGASLGDETWRARVHSAAVRIIETGSHLDEMGG